MTQKSNPFTPGKLVCRASEDELIDRDVNIKALLVIESMFGDKEHRILTVGTHNKSLYLTIEGSFSMRLQNLPANTYPAIWFNQT